VAIFGPCTAIYASPTPVLYDSSGHEVRRSQALRRKEQIVDLIREAFSATAYPGDAFLQGSFDGCEPYDEVGAFAGKTDWSRLDSAFLDAHYCALSFFSEGGFRYFLPAYLIADLRGELLTADPLFHLSHGFAVVSGEMQIGAQTFRRDSGGTTLVNPKRYGAIAWSDYARHRLSAFTREEARAIVEFMLYKREQDSAAASQIDKALNEFWLGRAENAPTREALEARVREDERFTAALQSRREEKR
jgi:hypothetical protein